MTIKTTIYEYEYDIIDRYLNKNGVDMISIEQTTIEKDLKGNFVKSFKTRLEPVKYGARTHMRLIKDNHLLNLDGKPYERPKKGKGEIINVQKIDSVTVFDKSQITEPKDFIMPIIEEIITVKKIEPEIKQEPEPIKQKEQNIKVGIKIMKKKTDNIFDCSSKIIYITIKNNDIDCSSDELWTFLMKIIRKDGRNLPSKIIKKDKQGYILDIYNQIRECMITKMEKIEEKEPGKYSEEWKIYSLKFIND